MKKLSLLLFALLILSCEKTKKPDYSIINGKIENMEAENIVIRGFDFTKEINIRNDNTFSDTLFLDRNGFYELYVGQMGVEIYLENGKNLEVNLDVEQPEELFTFGNDLKQENEFLFERDQWRRQDIDMAALFSLNEPEFKEAVKELQTNIVDLTEPFDLDNDFKNMISTESKHIGIMMLENYQNAHRYFAKNPEFKVSGGFYDHADDFKFNDVDLYENSPIYRDLVQVHYNRRAEEEFDTNSTLAFMNLINETFPDGSVKEELFYKHLQFGLSPTEYMTEVFDIYKNSNPDEEHLAELTERYNLYLTLLPGKPSPNFSDYENYKGGTVSLEDLKGKYVYIDVWATWCGPCLQEIPFLKEVEKDYANKNIQIVSMSIDVESAYNKWRDMIETKELGGLQILADKNWESSFVQEYGIYGIPRFILLDPEGNIVSADAPRPSNPELRTLFDELL